MKKFKVYYYVLPGYNVWECMVTALNANQAIALVRAMNKYFIIIKVIKL